VIVSLFPPLFLDVLKQMRASQDEAQLNRSTGARRQWSGKVAQQSRMRSLASEYVPASKVPLALFEKLSCHI
jgi:hypothetical protein